MILFDLGGVLVENASFEALARLLPAPLDHAGVRDRWLHSRTVREFELGLTSPDLFASRFVDEWGLDLTPSAFLERFDTWPSGPFPGAESLVARLRERHRVACLSNCNVLHWTRFSGLLRWFDFAFSSHLLGAIKPDAHAFRAVLDRVGVEARDVCFFDDSAANVRAASGLGMRAFRVDGIARVEGIVASLGLTGR